MAKYVTYNLYSCEKCGQGLYSLLELDDLICINPNCKKGKLVLIQNGDKIIFNYQQIPLPLGVTAHEKNPECVLTSKGSYYCVKWTGEKGCLRCLEDESGLFTGLTLQHCSPQAKPKVITYVCPRKAEIRKVR